MAGEGAFLSSLPHPGAQSSQHLGDAHQNLGEPSAARSRSRCLCRSSMGLGRDPKAAILLGAGAEGARVSRRHPATF